MKNESVPLTDSQQTWSLLPKTKESAITDTFALVVLSEPPVKTEPPDIPTGSNMKPLKPVLYI
jgi:hypothetical protein